MTGLLAVKLRRDLRVSWPRFVLMVLALTVSLAAFGSMLFAWSSVGRETSGAYMSTEPASATIVLEAGLDAEEMAALVAEARQRPGVLEATGRTQFDTTVEVNGQPREIPLQVFAAAPDDPMRMVRFDLGQEGVWPPSPDEILLGQDSSLSLVGAAVGDIATITPPGGDPVPLRISGTVYDPSLAPSPQEQRGHAYVSTAALAASGQPVVLDQLKLQIAEEGQSEPSRDRGQIVAAASDVSRWLRQDYGLAVAEIQVPEPHAHPHQWQADTLLVSLMGGAAAALLLSAILVATMLNNLFTQQIPQIGIMKAIGARSVRVGRFYLTMTLLVAAVATVLAIGPAILDGQNRLEGLLDMLGIQPEGLAPPWWAVVVLVTVGLGLPPLLALGPLVKASRITVRSAIDHHGGGARSSRAAGLLARVGRIRGLDRGLLMALRNTVRRPARFWLSVGLLAAAGMVFVAGMSVREGELAADEQQQEARYWDVAVELDDPARQEAVTSAAAQVTGVSQVEAWYRTQVGVSGQGQLPVTSTYPDQGHGSISLNTVPADPAVGPPAVLEGRWLAQGETGAVVLDERIHARTVPDAGAGDTVRLFIDGKPTTWRLVGVVDEGHAAAGGVYTTAEGLAAATGQPPQQVNQLRVITARDDEPTRQAVAGAVDEALTDAGVTVGLAASVSRSEAATAGHSGPVLQVLLVVALPMALIGGIGLAATMSSNILDRFREFGVLHAIGARPKAVRRIVMAEGVFLGVTSCLVAILPALALTRGIGVGLSMVFNNVPPPFRISLLAVGVWVAVAVLGAILATEAAATRASRITVREALTYL